MALLTLLFAEWLWPLLELTETYNVYPFLIFFGVVLFTCLFNCRAYLSIPVLSLFLLYLIHQLYFGSSFFSMDWFFDLLKKLLESIPVLLSWEWHHLAVEVRTFFFFILVWLVALSLYQNVFSRGRVLFFVVMTVGYLAVLDTFTPYDARMAILRAMVTSFLLLSLVQFSQLSATTSGAISRHGAISRPSGRRSWMWVLASLSFILLVVSVAYAAPKAGPSWPDPVPFIKSYATGSGGNEASQKVGYGQSDEVLGGPFVPDDTVVFEAVTPRLYYWRGESKDVYTGRGWETSEAMEWIFSFDQFTEARDIMETPFTDPQTETEQVQVTVRFQNQPRSQIFYPGDPLAINVFTNQSAVGAWEQGSGRLLVYESENQRRKVGLSGYQLKSLLPVYSVKALKAAEESQVPDEIMDRYTQLPDSLPDRVRTLAQDIVEEEETMYDQVRAIESYFRMNGYVYETEDVPIPEPGQDYVDQFLFETKRGYCDNFSTAMVVMLRTLDIPARWVKGFTGGQVKERDADTLMVEVDNSNAHSWVEVYFPGVGWVPFEPTTSFQNPFQFERDDLETRSPAEQEEEDPDAPQEEQPQEEEIDPAFSSDVSAFPNHGNTLSWVLIGVGIVLATVVLVRLFLWRKLILTWAIWRYKQGSNSQFLQQAYRFLIRYLGRFVQPKHPSQTLREYIASLESQLAVEKLKPLTYWYEETHYGKRPSSTNRLNQLYRLWLDLLKQLRSK
jgi:transglutaminase-like putative cysteine protease